MESDHLGTAVELDRGQNPMVTEFIIYVVSKDGDDLYGNDLMVRKVVGFLIYEAK